MKELEKVEMEKPTDSSRGGKKKRKEKSVEGVPWPWSKCSSDDLGIMVLMPFMGQHMNALDRTA